MHIGLQRGNLRPRTGMVTEQQITETDVVL
jgi:hypothetical protein